LNKPTQYFVQCHVDGTCFAYYRKRYEKNGLFEEVWQKKNKCWEQVPLRIIWMQISGECTLVQVSYEQFKQLLPEAFEVEGEVNNVP
jgi:hypothetical protein